MVNPQCTVQIACVDGYTAKPGVRNVSAETKASVFKEYGVDPKSDHFEVDHLISLELCGANDIHNLWPQSYTTLPNNAHVKDALEDRLHALVCSGKVPLAQPSTTSVLTKASFTSMREVLTDRINGLTFVLVGGQQRADQRSHSHAHRTKDTADFTARSKAQRTWLATASRCSNTCSRTAT